MEHRKISRKLSHALKECSNETFSIFWKIQIWKIRNFWNEITEFFFFFFYLQWSVFLIFVKTWTSALNFIFGWYIHDVNNEHSFWELLVDLLDRCYIASQVSWNFDLVKEILKIRCQIYILMKQVITLRKIQMAMKTFARPFFNHFSLSLSRKKRVVMRVMRKKLNIFTLQLPIYYILEKEISISVNTDIAKTKREK